MLLLHLSDLHFGAYSRFVDQMPDNLAAALTRTAERARKDFFSASQFDLLLVTGDLAETAHPDEFDQAGQFLAHLSDHLGLERRKVVFVPGNHDVSWPACEIVRAKVRMGTIPQTELSHHLATEKLSHYRRCVERFYRATLSHFAQPLGFDAFLYSYPDLQLSVAAVNSCEKESELANEHGGQVSLDQANAVMKAWRGPEVGGVVKVLAVHHNPDTTTRTNVESWRRYLLEKGRIEKDLLARYESDVLGLENADFLRAIVADCQVQLVLHGHHHAKDEKTWAWHKNGRAHILSAGSLALRTDKLPGEEPASFRLIELLQTRIRARSLIYDARARQDGQVRKGSFVPDPAEDGGYEHRLDLPSGFRFASQARTPSRVGHAARTRRSGMPQYSWAEDLVQLARDGVWARLQVLPGNGAEEVNAFLQRRLRDSRVVFVDLATIRAAEDILESIGDAGDTMPAAPGRYHQVARAVAGSREHLVIVLAGWGAHAQIHGRESLGPMALALQNFKNVVRPQIVLVCVSPTPISHLFASPLGVGSLLNLTPVLPSAADAKALEDWARSKLSMTAPPEMTELIDAAAGQLGAIRAAALAPGRSQAERLHAIRVAHEDAGLAILGAVGPCCAAVLRGESQAARCLSALTAAGILDSRDENHLPRVKAWAYSWGVSEYLP
jgi:hypothetical protein